MAKTWRIVKLTKKSAPRSGLVIFEEFDDSAFRFTGRFAVGDAKAGPDVWQSWYPVRNIGHARERLRASLEQTEWAAAKAKADKADAAAAKAADAKAKADAKAAAAAVKAAAPAAVKVPVVDKLALLREQVRAERDADNPDKLAAAAEIQSRNIGPYLKTYLKNGRVVRDAQTGLWRLTRAWDCA